MRVAFARGGQEGPLRASRLQSDHSQPASHRLPRLGFCAVSVRATGRAYMRRRWAATTVVVPQWRARHAMLDGIWGALVFPGGGATRQCTGPRTSDHRPHRSPDSGREYSSHDVPSCLARIVPRWRGVKAPHGGGPRSDPASATDAGVRGAGRCCTPRSHMRHIIDQLSRS